MTREANNPSGPKEAGAREEDLALVAEQAFGNGALGTNPRSVGREEVLQIVGEDC